MASSSGKNLRIIEVELNSVKLNSRKVGSFYYVVISISKTQELKSKSVKFSEDSSRLASWSQKFVFSVPHDFIFKADSRVSFAVFKVRKYLPDVAIGKATADMRTLFPIEEQEEIHQKRGPVVYDTDTDTDEEDGDGGVDIQEEEEEEEEKEAFQLEAAAGLPILKGSSPSVGTLNICVTAWEKYSPHQVSLYGREKISYPIYCDSQKVGDMSLQKTKQEKCITLVGNVKWRNLAMDFDELTMLSQTVLKKNRPKTSRRLGSCFANASATTIN